MQERLQKILSARGIASRRKAEEYITRGLVKVNGVVATLGQKADLTVDTVEVDGEVLEERKQMLYYLLNKPVGVETSNVAIPGANNVRNLLPEALQGKIYPVGRLDKDSCGLLLLTNDGVLAYRLTHPKFDHEKEYLVEVETPMSVVSLERLSKGMIIMGEKTKPAEVHRFGPRKFTITLTEGRNRQIRRMCLKVGCPVRHLQRIRIMTLRDEKLKQGDLRKLTQPEIDALVSAVGSQS